ncbi:glutathione S-transferase family protein [Pseudoduganella sp. SL102]|uniref:glutathione S-transferase family protein n=1 Tax=Pseudoduganella sp. SL102 TaxID=2995154 RepID=UPI00248B7C5B|nr:glutathione S-transferase family protein [Pseudoduganella sp. SL102]WBS02946.1 glutathione S-transferase family protein [Pseudoduganella sp. SL102]
MLTILGKLPSINVRKVLWTCRLLELPYELEPWGKGERDPNVPEFLALNPNAQVPVLRDGDTVLWESNTICRYLAHDSFLLPSDRLQRARIEQWMDWQATELNASWRAPFMTLLRGSTQFSPEAVAAGVRDWNTKMTLLDRHLARTGAFVAGDTVSLADVVIGVSVHRWRATPIERAELPAVAAYMARLSAVPGFAENCGDATP